MAIIFRDSNGTIFKIPDGVPYKRKPDWEEIGSEIDQKEAELNDVIAKIGNAVGLGIDETITRLAQALNIPKCASCQMRGQILRKMGQLGWMETVRRLRTTFKKDA